MKTLNQIIKEATREINELPRRSKAFVDKHVVQKMDYPVDVEDQFTAKKLKKDKTKLASFHDGEDASVYEEVDLEEGVSNLSDARLKFHVLKDIPHGSYTKKEMAAEHLRRKKAGGPAYNAVKPSLNEEVELDEAQVKKPTSYERAVALPDGEPDKSAKMGVNKAAYAAASAAAKPKSQVSLKKAPWDMKKEEVDLDEAYTLYHPSYTDAINTALSHHKDLTVSGDDRDTHIASGPRKPSEGKTVSHNIPATDKSGNAHMIHIQVYNKGGSKPFELNTYSSKVPKKKMKEEASMSPTDMKQREDIVKGMKKNTQDFKDRYGSKWKSVMYATATKAAMKEEAEQIDEISRDLARRYIRKVADKNNTGQASPKEVMKRSPGIALAGKKAYGIGGKARVNATEEVELDEAFKAGAMKLNDGSSVTLTSESSNSLNNLFNQLSSPNKTKMEQRLMSGSKGFNEILAFAKEV